MVLHGARLLLRPFTEADLDPILAILAEPEVARWWGEYDRAKARGEFLDDPQVEALAIEIDGAVAGVIEIVEEDEPDYRHASLDIALATSHHDRGLGREALRVVIDHLVDGRGHHRVTIDPRADNARAIACYAAVGFKPVGVMRQYERETTGTWQDALLMDLLADDRL
ncbi:MAG TPA: GNAT family protein [Thermoleophilaceae bacterium]